MSQAGMSIPCGWGVAFGENANNSVKCTIFYRKLGKNSMSYLYHIILIDLLDGAICERKGESP